MENINNKNYGILDVRDFPSALPFGKYTLHGQYLHKGDGSRAIILPQRRADLLNILVRNLGSVVTCRSIMEALYGLPYNEKKLPNIITSIRKLHTNLEGDESIRLDKVAGKGYRLSAANVSLEEEEEMPQLKRVQKRTVSKRKRGRPPKKCTVSPAPKLIPEKPICFFEGSLYSDRLEMPGGVIVKLSKLHRVVLLVLYQQRGSIVSYDHILDAMYNGQGPEFKLESMMECVQELRGRLAVVPWMEIKTFRKIGYRLDLAPSHRVKKVESNVVPKPDKNCIAYHGTLLAPHLLIRPDRSRVRLSTRQYLLLKYLFNHSDKPVLKWDLTKSIFDESLSTVQVEEQFALLLRQLQFLLWDTNISIIPVSKQIYCLTRSSLAYGKLFSKVTPRYFGNSVLLHNHLYSLEEGHTKVLIPNHLVALSLLLDNKGKVVPFATLAAHVKEKTGAEVSKKGYIMFANRLRAHLSKDPNVVLETVRKGGIRLTLINERNGQQGGISLKNNPMFKFAGYTLTEGNLVKAGRVIINLEPRQFELLEVFFRNPGRNLSQQDIVKHLKCPHFVVTFREVREKLKNTALELIASVPAGFCLQRNPRWNFRESKPASDFHIPFHFICHLIENKVRAAFSQPESQTFTSGEVKAELNGWIEETVINKAFNAVIDCYLSAGYIQRFQNGKFVLLQKPLSPAFFVKGNQDSSFESIKA